MMSTNNDIKYSNELNKIIGIDLETMCLRSDGLFDICMYSSGLTIEKFNILKGYKKLVVF
jgi:hypothetical protein